MAGRSFWNLRQALRASPRDIYYSGENAGRAVPGVSDHLSILTDRQLEVLQTAVEQGNYDVPRNATQEDIAETLDCAPSTVDEHLPKTEAHVVSELVQFGG